MQEFTILELDTPFNTMIDKNTIAEAFKTLQDNICSSLEKEDGHGFFKEDIRRRPGGGGGRSRILESNVIEKGGVNFSAVAGELPQNIVTALKVADNQFFATGVSIVIHPKNPFVPIIHMNIRYFELSDGTYWFGGGIDLTPHYIIEEDATFFHNELKRVCNTHNNTYYPKFKKWADDYFFIKHRNETRGIGGIFFDRLNETSEEKSKNEIFEFVLNIGQLFAPTYIALVAKNKNKTYTDQQKNWQYIRRSRYVEFNLVYDKGTKFGLDTDGRIESILMSMPPEARWPYQFTPEKNSAEEKTLKLLKKDINWA